MLPLGLGKRGSGWYCRQVAPVELRLPLLDVMIQRCKFGGRGGGARGRGGQGRRGTSPTAVCLGEKNKACTVTIGVGLRVAKFRAGGDQNVCWSRGLLTNYD